jgi:hypothetical protein
MTTEANIISIVRTLPNLKKEIVFFHKTSKNVLKCKKMPKKNQKKIKTFFKNQCFLKNQNVLKVLNIKTFQKNYKLNILSRKLKC